jgi:putative peptidoglycan lipid II flippase
VIARLNPVADQWAAGLVGLVGGGTLIRYADDVALSPTSMLQSVLFAVLMADLARHLVDGRRDRVRATLYRTLAVTLALLAVVAAVLVAIRRPLCRLLFLHGAMDAAAVEQLAGLLPWYLVGLPPYGALLVLARAHVAVGNTRVMFSTALCHVALNLGLNILLVWRLGLAGVALSTTLTHTVIGALLWVRLQPLLGKGLSGRELVQPRSGPEAALPRLEARTPRSSLDDD